jgi:anhydro-N-acetylmuramic acid kinase
MNGERFIGLMTGTSLDAVDAALLRRDGDRIVLEATLSHPLGTQLRRELTRLCHARTVAPEEIMAADLALGERLAESVDTLIRQAGLKSSDIRAIGSHGQTIRHLPAGSSVGSWQIGDPGLLALKTEITVVADFRRRDMALGGQGAPLAPAFHAAVFAHPDEIRVVVNIGGMANLSLLAPGREVLGWDTGPGNILLDTWYRAHHRRGHWDEGGAWAAAGQPLPDLLQHFLHDGYFEQVPPKSTGREHFNREWLDRKLETYQRVPAASDVQATLLALTADSIAREIGRLELRPEAVYVCGGGAHNKALMEGLARRLPQVRVETTAALGIDPDWVEAAAFAWLAGETLAGRPGNLPSVTGASRPAILGAIYPA